MTDKLNQNEDATDPLAEESKDEEQAPQVDDVDPLALEIHGVPSSPSSAEIILYKSRFLVAFAFGLNNALSQFTAIAYASIQEASALKYNVSQREINMFSLMYPILCIPGSILCVYMFARWDLRPSFIFSSCMMCFGCLLRYLSVLDSIFPSSHTSSGYYVALTGTFFIALVQPFYNNSASRIAAEWFSVDGRGVATALFVVIIALGYGAGMYAPTLFVHYNSASSETFSPDFGGFAGSLGLQFILSGICLLVTLLFHKNKPPTPPSMSQFLKRSQKDAASVKSARENVDVVRINWNCSTLKKMKQELSNVCKNLEFLKLWIGFGCIMGYLVALCTEINQYTAAFGYDSNDAGAFGLCINLGSVLGGIVCAYIMEKTRKLRIVLKAGMLVSFIVTAVFVTQMQENNLYVLCVVFSVWGFVTGPMMTVLIELGAEVTFPANEEYSNGMLVLSSGAGCIAFVLIWDAFLPTTGEFYKNNIWNGSTWFILVVNIVALVTTLLYKGQYKRLSVESIQTKSVIMSINPPSQSQQVAGKSEYNRIEYHPESSGD